MLNNHIFCRFNSYIVELGQETANEFMYLSTYSYPDESFSRPFWVNFDKLFDTFGTYVSKGSEM